MLNDASCFKRVIIAAGYTDLRSGIDKLAAMIKFRYHPEPRDRNTLFLFCGKRADRIKGLVLEGDGWLLLYCKCQYKNVQKVENINVQFTVSGFSLLSFQDRTFVLQTIR